MTLLTEEKIRSSLQVTISKLPQIFYYTESTAIFLFSYLESDPFYELQESHILIGVANMYMDVLFHDVKLNYYVPIISQQGEVAGKLQVNFEY